MKIDPETGEIEFPRVRVFKHQHKNAVRMLRMERYNNGEIRMTIEVVQVSVQRKGAARHSESAALPRQALDDLQRRLYGARSRVPNR
jgi:hypothetical protein